MKIYDHEFDVLSVNNNRVTHSSIQLGELIVDFDRDMRLSGIEIMNPDKYLGISKKLLNELKVAKISAQNRHGVMLIQISLCFANGRQNVEKNFSIPLMVEQKIAH